MYNRDANRSRRKMTARTPLRANTKTRDELDTLGRDNTTKRGPKSDKDDGPKYTPEQRRLLDTWGKYVRLNGAIVETLHNTVNEHKFVKV